MATYIQIGSTVTVGAIGATSIDFTSIPATYTDLVIKLTARSTDPTLSYSNLNMQFNGDTASNYKSILAYGTGSGVGSDNAGGAINSIRFFYATGSTATSNTFASTDIYISNYAGSTQKSCSLDSVTENNATSVLTGITAGLWTGTSAITSIKLYGATYSFTQYSTATLYGISKS
jgi:hypothetical protein